MKNAAARTLDALERIVKTDMRYLLSGSFWLLVGQVATAASSFILAIVFARILPKEVYGSYKYALSLYAILSIPTLVGIDTAVNQAAAKGVDGALIAGLRAKIRYGALGSVAALVLGGYYALHGNTALALSLLIVAAFLPFADTLALFYSYLEGKRLFKQEAVYRTLIQIGSAASLMAAGYITHSALWMLFAYFVPFTVGRYIAHRHIIRTYRITDDSRSHEVVRTGFHFSVMEFVASLGSNLDDILLFHFVGPASVAVYTFATAPALEMRAVINNVLTLALPKMVSRKLEELAHTLWGSMARFLLVVAPLVVIYIVLAPAFFHLFFPAYADAIVYSQVFALLLLFIPKNLIGTSFTAHLRKKELYILNGTINGTRVVLLFALLPRFGIWGAIASLLLAQVAHTIVSFVLLFTVRSRSGGSSS